MSRFTRHGRRAGPVVFAAALLGAALAPGGASAEGWSGCGPLFHCHPKPAGILSPYACYGYFPTVWQPWVTVCPPHLLKPVEGYQAATPAPAASGREELPQPKEATPPKELTPPGTTTPGVSSSGYTPYGVPQRPIAVPGPILLRD